MTNKSAQLPQLHVGQRYQQPQTFPILDNYNVPIRNIKNNIQNYEDRARSIRNMMETLEARNVSKRSLEKKKNIQKQVLKFPSIFNSENNEQKDRSISDIDLNEFEKKLINVPKKGFSQQSRQQSIILKDNAGYKLLKKIKNQSNYAQMNSNS